MMGWKKCLLVFLTIFLCFSLNGRTVLAKENVQTEETASKLIENSEKTVKWKSSGPKPYHMTLEEIKNELKKMEKWSEENNTDKDEAFIDRQDDLKTYLNQAEKYFSMKEKEGEFSGPEYAKDMYQEVINLAVIDP